MQKLDTDKLKRHGNNLRPVIRKHLYEHFERKFIYPFIKTFLLIYIRVIDDKLFISTCSKVDLEKFLNELNTKHPSINFEYEISKERILFVDTENFS